MLVYGILCQGARVSLDRMAASDLNRILDGWVCSTRCFDAESFAAFQEQAKIVVDARAMGLLPESA